MCMAHTCPTCNGKTWTGCGMHVASVMDSIPKDQWCTCTAESTKGGKVVKEGYPPGFVRPPRTVEQKEKDAAAAAQGSEGGASA